MPLFKQLPVDVEARLYDPELDADHAADVADWCGGVDPVDAPGGFPAETSRIGILSEFGMLWARPGDYIVLDQLGDFHPVAPETFRVSYEPVDRPPTITKRIGDWWNNSVAGA